MNPTINGGFDWMFGLVGVIYIVAIAMSIAGFIFAMLTMLASRRTAKATEALLEELADLKVQLAEAPRVGE